MRANFIVIERHNLDSYLNPDFDHEKAPSFLPKATLLRVNGVIMIYFALAESLLAEYLFDELIISLRVRPDLLMLSLCELELLLNPLIVY